MSVLNRTFPRKAQDRSVEIAMKPCWKPLEQMLGADLCRNFMYMGCSGQIYLYKHIDTRRYLNIDLDGACFRYSPAGYIPIGLMEAIEDVLS